MTPFEGSPQNQPQLSVEETTEAMLNTFLANHPEYADRNFSPEEMKEAVAMGSNLNITGSDEELAKKILDARLTVRANKLGHVSDLG